jgi:hypothetical protein
MENYTEKEVWAFGEICYYNSKDQFHRIDGPAVEWPNGDNFWYIYGQDYLKVEHNRLVLFSILEPQRIELCPTKD